MRREVDEADRGTGWAGGGLVSVVVLLLSLVATAGAEGQIRIFEGEAADRPLELDLTGYVRSLTGIHDTGYDLPAGDRRSAFNAEVVRLEWGAAWGDRIRLDVHQRFQVQVSTDEEGFGSSVAGFGVSALPGRAVDLEWTWVDDERLRAWHDVDRLALSIRTSAADVTLGRQAITWGNAQIFPVADLWARFSPFELDTEEKPGVDAIRVLAYPAPGLELDAVVADRGRRDDVSAGARASLSLPGADVYVAGGRLWNEAMAMAGVTWLLESTRLRAEGLVARDLEEGRWLDPRATVGIDRIGARWSVTGELHFNGLGTGDPSGYLERLGSESFARGESYHLGRVHAGGSVAWTADRAEQLRLLGSVLFNLDDGSVALSPVGTWDVGAAVTLSLGGLLTSGDTPAFTGPLPELASEYGSYGDLGYTRVSVYF